MNYKSDRRLDPEFWQPLEEKLDTQGRVYAGDIAEQVAPGRHAVAITIRSSDTKLYAHILKSVRGFDVLQKGKNGLTLIAAVPSEKDAERLSKKVSTVVDAYSNGTEVEPWLFGVCDDGQLSLTEGVREARLLSNLPLSVEQLEDRLHGLMQEYPELFEGVDVVHAPVATRAHYLPVSTCEGQVYATEQRIFGNRNSPVSIANYVQGRDLVVCPARPGLSSEYNPLENTITLKLGESLSPSIEKSDVYE